MLIIFSYCQFLIVIVYGDKVTKFHNNTKIFFTKYKTTPRQFILDFRIRKAKQLLLDTSLSITAIAKAGAVMSYEEYVAAELDSQVTVECYVQNTQSWWEAYSKTQLEDLIRKSYLKQRWLNALLMWTQGPQSPLEKAMGSQDGNSCREREGQGFISKSVSSLRANSLVYLVFVLFFLKDYWGLVWEMALRAQDH